MRNCILIAIAAAACLAAACASRSEPAPQLQPIGEADPSPRAVVDTSGAPPAVDETQWHDLLLKAASEYQAYKRLGDDPQYAPTMCRPPRNDKGLRSEAERKTPHGRKLYYMFARDHAAYYTPGKATVEQPVGQVLVKESFHPKAAGSRELGDKFALFVMLRLDPSTPGTDIGWVYGTLDADGKTVTGAGRMESCMGCHVDAGESRMFGPQGKRLEWR